MYKCHIYINVYKCHIYIFIYIAYLYVYYDRYMYMIHNSRWGLEPFVDLQAI